VTDPWQAQREALGAFIRSQRKMANLSLRQLAELTSLSNPYLSQVERGLHQPSVRVLKAISDALNLSAETLLAQAGLVDAVAGEVADAGQATQHAQAGGATGQKVQTEDAIRADERLSDDQKAALIAVYRTMLGGLPPGMVRWPLRHFCPAGSGVGSGRSAGCLFESRQMRRCTGIKRGMSRRPGMNGTKSRSRVARPVI
jgi:transcriptional regulator with XRE-family HTH domain